jgi:tRNA A-37 threonylcarbamoyl transferase component Bud32
LDIKLNELQLIFSKESFIVYKAFYGQVDNTQLKEIFSVIHFQLNSLLSFLNNKKFSGHYNAHESRDLIYIINLIKRAKLVLKDSKFNFEVDEYYEGILTSCEDFLRESGGSPIPDEFPKIEIIENKPIFSLSESTTIQSPHMISSFPTKVIGEGSYATVHKYKDTHYDRFFAIKKAKKDLSLEELIRFRTEFEELKKLNSPYVIEVYNYDEEKNQYTMEFADTTLAEYISKNNNKLTIHQRIQLVLQILRSFSYIHNKVLLHRDISYQNILIKYYDEDLAVIKVSDFGLVKLRESNLTRHGTDIKGTLNDPSLSQIGFENYEVRHEIYALARVINFVLTGKTAGVFYDSENVKNFILRGMAANIEERFPSVEEMTKEFNKIKNELL